MGGQFDPYDLQSNEERAASEAWKQFVAEDEGYDRAPLRLSAGQLEVVFETTRNTLEEAGIPFVRANRLAERVLAAVRSL